MAKKLMTVSRRALLRGAGGVALSLPLLEAMQPRRAHAAEAPKRLLVWTTPNGTVIDRFVCKAGATESDFGLSEILSPLEPHKSDIVVLQGLHQWGGHAHQWAPSLTARKALDRGFPKLYGAGVSVDQLIAQKWEGRTPIPSMQIGVMVNEIRDSASCVSWAGADKGMPPENNPFKIFARLFTSGAPTPAAMANAKAVVSSKRSILDSVIMQTAAFAQPLGKSDKRVMDNYLDSIRGMEKQIAALEQRQAQSAGHCAPPDIGADPTPAGATKPWWNTSTNVPQVIKLQCDLIAAIFACDLTRVITFNLTHSGGANRSHTYIPGAEKPGDWHAFSHMVEKGDEVGMVAIEKWYWGHFAYLVGKLKESMDVNGKSVLYNSLVLNNDEYGPNGPISFLNPKSNYSHYALMMPYLTAGQAGGALKSGRNLVYAVDKEGKGPPHAQLLVSVLNAMGIPDQTFGDPMAKQGPLPRMLG